jgi:hypothetical protein
MAHVSGGSNLGTDVVVQVAGEMKQQVANAVSVRIGTAPDLLVGQGVNQGMDAVADRFVVGGEAGIDSCGQISHECASPGELSTFFQMTGYDSKVN